MNKETRRLTLEDIGKRAGVSRATVSRVINNHPYITDEVRERVQRVIQETGYQPNRIARSLASHRTGMIGLVIPHDANTIMTNPYFLHLITSLTSAANQNDLTLALFLFHSSDEEERIASTIFSNSLVDGVIVTADRSENAFVPQLLAHHVAVAFIGKPEPGVEVPYVNVDNEAGGYLATKHLIKRGCQRIGTIAVRYNSAGNDRFDGYRQALADTGQDIDDDLIAVGDFSQSSGYRAMQKLLSAQPDAVFAASDQMAIGASRAIREAGLRIPDDVALIGFDDLPSAANAEPPLTTIRQPIDQLGPVAIDILKQVIDNKIDATHRRILPTELVIRAT